MPLYSRLVSLRFSGILLHSSNSSSIVSFHLGESLKMVPNFVFSIYIFMFHSLASLMRHAVAFAGYIRFL